MKDDVTISVLMPVFRPEVSFLKEAVESILNQTFSDFELLLLCEGTFEPEADAYINGIDDPRVIRVDIAAKTGLPGSLNIGIDRARGEFLARMDADDIAVRDRFEKQVAYLRAHPGIAILGGVVRVIGKQVLLGSVFCEPEVRKARMLFANAGVIHPTVMFRKSFFDEHDLRYDTSRRGSEDYALWGEAALCGAGIDSLTDVVLNYRIHESQASVVLSEQILAWDGEVKKKLWRTFTDFSDKQMKLILEFVKPVPLLHAPEMYEILMRKLIKANETKRLVDLAVFDKEIRWQWFRQVIHQVRYEKNMGFLRCRLTISCLRPDRAVYIVKNYLAQIKENRQTGQL